MGTIVSLWIQTHAKHFYELSFQQKYITTAKRIFLQNCARALIIWIL